MTGSQKAIKVLSIIVIVVAILSILAGIITFTGGMANVMAGADASTAEQQQLALGAGLLFVLAGGAIVSGVIDLVVGLLGLRGAKDPNKIMPFFVIAIIGAVFAVLNLVGCLASGQAGGTDIASAVVQLVLMVVCVVLANNVRKLRS